MLEAALEVASIKRVVVTSSCKCLGLVCVGLVLTGRCYFDSV